MARPREFDPQEALEKAMQQFWKAGYHDTSIRDLVDCTGVNYYGLYGAFDSKHGLFLAALDRYRAKLKAEVISELRKPGALRKTIERTFRRMLAFMQTPDGSVGCLMVNTAVEMVPSDPEAAALNRALFKDWKGAFCQKLAEGQAAGELSKNQDPVALAEFLATTACSVAYLQRSGSGDAQIKRYIHTALSVLA